MTAFTYPESHWGPTPAGSAAALLAAATTEDLHNGDIAITFPNGVRLLMQTDGSVAQLSRDGMLGHLLEDSDDGMYVVEVEFRDQ